MLEPWDKGLMGTTLRYPYEIRDAKEYFEDIPNLKVKPDMLKLAEHILQSKAADFDPAQFVDHYEEAVLEMLKKKQAGMPVSREHAAPRPQNVVNLREALRRSIAQEKGAGLIDRIQTKRLDAISGGKPYEKCTIAEINQAPDFMFSIKARYHGGTTVEMGARWFGQITKCLANKLNAFMGGSTTASR